MPDNEVVSDPSESWEERSDWSPSPITETDIEHRVVGRGRHLVLLASISAEEIIDRLEPILEELGKYECVAPTPPENLHVTVKVIGDVVTEPRAVGEFSPTDERQLIQSIRDYIGDISSFTVTFPQLNLFPTVVYAEVSDNDYFAELNQRICEIPTIPVLERDNAFIPHLTLGHFTQRDGYRELVQYLEDNRSLTVPEVTVTEVELVALDFAEGRFPSHTTVETYELQ